MDNTEKRIILIGVGIGLFVLGSYLAYEPLKDLIPRHLSWMEFQTESLKTNYPIGIGFTAVGLVSIVFGIMWKRISTKYKS